MGSRRRVRHLADLQLKRLYTGPGQPVNHGSIWFRLEAGASDAGPWQPYHISEQVVPDLELQWSPIPRVNASIACQPCEPSSSCIPDTGDPAGQFSTGCTTSHIGECQHVRLTIFSSLPVQKLQQTTVEYSTAAAAATPVAAAATAAAVVAGAPQPIAAAAGAEAAEAAAAALEPAAPTEPCTEQLASPVTPHGEQDYADKQLQPTEKQRFIFTSASDHMASSSMRSGSTAFATAQRPVAEPRAVHVQITAVRSATPQELANSSTGTACDNATAEDPCMVHVRMTPADDCLPAMHPHDTHVLSPRADYLAVSNVRQQLGLSDASGHAQAGGGDAHASGQVHVDISCGGPDNSCSLQLTVQMPSSSLPSSSVIRFVDGQPDQTQQQQQQQLVQPDQQEQQQQPEEQQREQQDQEQLSTEEGRPYTNELQLQLQQASVLQPAVAHSCNLPVTDNALKPVSHLIGPAVQHVTWPKKSRPAPTDKAAGRVLLQLQFNAADLVAIDLVALERYARGMNQVVFHLMDGSTCVPTHAHVLQGLSFVAPLPLLNHVAVEALSHVAHANENGLQFERLDSLLGSPGPADPHLDQQELQNQMLCRWMVDTGSVIAPLGAAHSLDPDSAAFLLAPDGSAARLVGEAAGGMAGAAGQGFMPSMMAMLFGPAAAMQGSMPLTRPSSPALMPPYKSSNNTSNNTSTHSTAHPLPSRPTGPQVAPGPAIPSPLKTHTMSGAGSTTAGAPGRFKRIGSQQQLLPPRQPAAPSSPRPAPVPAPPGHRRTASASAFIHPSSGSSPSATSSSPFATAANPSVLPSALPSRLQQGSRVVERGAEVGAGGRNAHPAGSPAAMSPMAGRTRHTADHQDFQSHVTPSASRQARVYGVEDLESSTRRLMAAQGRLERARAARHHMQQQIVQALKAGQLSFYQQRALAAERQQVAWQSEQAEAARGRAQAMRRLADDTHRSLQHRCKEQQAATKQLKAAHQRLKAAQETLAGPEGLGTWRALHAIVTGRVNSLTAGLAAAYELGPRGAHIRLASAPAHTTPLTSSPHPAGSNALAQHAEQQQRLLHAAGKETVGRKSTGANGAGSVTRRRPFHRHSQSLEEMLAAQPLERTMDASWWASGAGEVDGDSPCSSEASCDSNELGDIIWRVLTGPTPASRSTSFGGGSGGPGGTSSKAGSSGRTHTYTDGAGHDTHPSGGSYSSGLGGGGVGLWGGLSSWGAVTRPAGDAVPLCVLGLELPANLAKRSLEGSVGWGSSPDEEQRVAAALGYVAHVVDRLACYMDIPLRYPILPGMSKSHIWDPCPMVQAPQPATGGLLHRSIGRLLGSHTGDRPAPPTPDSQGGNPSRWLLGSMPSGLLHGPAQLSSNQQSPGTSLHNGTVGKTGLWGGRADVVSVRAALAPAMHAAHGGDSRAGAALLPLYTDGRDRTRFAYAVYLLNKDVELLMQAHGLASLGPNQLLRNLYHLAIAALSGIS